MHPPRTRSAVGLLVVALALLVPFSAHADSQPVSATVASVLGITVSSSVTLSNLSPGGTSTGQGTVTVVATGPWVLRLSDQAASNAGHLKRTSGSTGTSTLANALDWSTAASVGTGGSGTLSGTATVGASGTLSDVVTATYSQDVDSNELLAAGSVYGLTVTWTIAAS